MLSNLFLPFAYGGYYGSADGSKHFLRYSSWALLNDFYEQSGGAAPSVAILNVPLGIICDFDSGELFSSDWLS